MKLTEHQRLLLPFDPALPATVGGRLPSIPLLWERAKLFFSRVITHIGSTSDFSKRWRLTRQEKKEVLGWLEPVEKLARSCLLVRALSFLMMTPDGRKLMRETPKLAMPSPPKPPGKANPFSTKIPLGGWHTHAPYARVLAERRKLEEQKAAERAARDRHDPANWGGGFRVLHWQFPEPDAGERAVPAPFRKARRVGIDVIEPGPWPAIGSPVSTPRAECEQERPSLILARRIEALARVLNNPAPAIRRLARFIARLPREALEPLTETVSLRGPSWRHGGEDAISAAAHVRRASAVYCYIQPG